MIEKAQMQAMNNQTPNINKTDDKEALKEQTDKFESIMVKTLLDAAMPKENPMFPKSAGSDIYKSMYNKQMSESLSGGFGFSKLMFDFLTREDSVALNKK
ncbi:MAG: rod-binding protein [Campylobacterota bacterium]